MAGQMTRRERLDAAIRGEAVDRVPWSLWRHYYDREASAGQLADTMVAWTERYGFDLLKINPRAEYHVEDWGVRFQPSGTPNDRPTRVESAVTQPDDWRRLRPIGADGASLAEQLEAVRQIRARLGPDQPMVETLFLPLMVAGYLPESEAVLQQAIERQPNDVHHVLEVITETYTAFVARCVEAGADGFFFATTWATPAKLTAEQYAQFGTPYDLRVIEAARRGGARLNVLHVCGDGARVLDFADYAVDFVSYAATSPGNPGLEQTVGRLPGAVIGGLSPEGVSASDAGQAQAEAQRALAATGGRHWLLGGACSLPMTARDENLRAAAEAVGIEPNR